MEHLNIRLTCMFALASFLMTSTGILAAGKGSLPNGKPFQELAEQIEANTKLIEQNSQEILNLDGAFSDIKLEVTRINTDLSTLANTVATNSAEIVTAKQHLDTAEGDIDALTVELKALIEKHQADIGTINAELAQIRLDLAGLAALSANLAEDLDAAVTSLGGDISSVQSDIIQLNASLAMVNSQFITLSATQATLSASVDSLSGMVAALELATSDLGNRTSALEALHFDDTSADTSYEGAFTSNQLSTETAKQDWLDFRASLFAKSFATVEISSSNGGSVTCSDPTSVSNIAAALAAGNSTSEFCDENYWNVGVCWLDGLLSIELNASDSDGVCLCDSYASVRPRIGNVNWGGVGDSFGGVGSGNRGTCAAISQSLRVVFSD